MNKNLGAPAFFEKNKINIDLFTLKNEQQIKDQCKSSNHTSFEKM